MAFKLKTASCVVVGTFNIYVIQPKLLTEIGVFPASDEFRIETNLEQPGFRFTCARAPCVKWSVRPDRLTVESTDSDSDNGANIAAVLEALKWTPVSAIGTNLLLEADLTQQAQIAPNFRLPTADVEADVGALKQCTAHVGIQIADQLYNIQLAQRANGLELALNVHTALTVGHGARLDQIGKAIAAARSSMEHRQKSIELAQSILGVEVLL